MYVPRTLVPAFLAAAVAASASLAPPQPADAQVPPVRTGAYLVRARQNLDGDRWEEVAIPRGFPMRLFLLPGGVYVWGDNQQAFHSEYSVGFRDTPQGRVATIKLRHRWAGDVWQEGSSTKLALVFTHNAVVQRTVLEYVGPLEQHRPPDPLPERMRCEAKHWPTGAAPEPVVASGPSGRHLLAGAPDLTAQTTERTVNGEMLIALASSANLSDEQRRERPSQVLGNPLRGLGLIHRLGAEERPRVVRDRGAPGRVVHQVPVRGGAGQQVASGCAGIDTRILSTIRRTSRSAAR
jgi:hypothetical protein